jgi:hypothetical protein
MSRFELMSERMSPGTRLDNVKANAPTIGSETKVTQPQVSRTTCTASSGSPMLTSTRTHRLSVGSSSLNVAHSERVPRSSTRIPLRCAPGSFMSNHTRSTW